MRWSVREIIDADLEGGATTERTDNRSLTANLFLARDGRGEEFDRGVWTAGLNVAPKWLGMLRPADRAGNNSIG